MFSLRNYSKINLFLLIILVFNIAYARSPFFGVFFGLWFLFWNGAVLGSVFFNNEKRVFRFLYGLLFLAAIFIILGSIVYYLWELNPESTSLIIISVTFLVPTLNYFLKNKAKTKNEPEPRPFFEFTTFKGPDLTMPFWGFLFLIVFGLELFYLYQSATTGAITSPWVMLPPQFFIYYFLAILALLFIFFKNKTNPLSFIFLVLQTFITVGVALFVYKIGFGFDSFIHQAAQMRIADFGEISPKPFYYIGQYSLVVLLSKLLVLPTSGVDKLLLPILLSLFLPTTIYYSLNRGLNISRGTSALLSPLFFVLPFGSFIVTTPQGMANLFLVLIIFFSLTAAGRGRTPTRVVFLITLGLAALLIHPLTGIPIIFFLSLLFVQNRWLRSLVFIFACLTLPVVFILLSFISKTIFPSIHLEFSGTLANLLAPVREPFQIHKNFQLLLDLVYAYYKFLIPVFAAISFLGMAYAKFRRKLAPQLHFILIFIALVVNYLLIKAFIKFPFLIRYEQEDYSKRILEIGLYFLLPFFLITLAAGVEGAKKSRALLRFGLLALLAFFLTSAFYLSYPRDDNYVHGHAWSVSEADIRAVRWIDQDAKSKKSNAERGSARADNDYIVLANQSVSAAALREFGFAKYYRSGASIIPETEIFYYPIPTGGPLYQYYLKMVYEVPNRQTIEEAMDLAGVKLAYFVLNNYWTNFNKIAEQAKFWADDWQEIDSGRTLIFRYKNE